MELRAQIVPWFTDSGIPELDEGITHVLLLGVLVKSASGGTAAIRQINEEIPVNTVNNRP